MLVEPGPRRAQGRRLCPLSAPRRRHPATGPALLGVGRPGPEGQGLGLSVHAIALACHSRCSLEGRCSGSYL